MKLDKEKVYSLKARQGMLLKDLSATSGVGLTTIHKGFKTDISPVCIGKLAIALGVEMEGIIETDVERSKKDGLR